MRSCGFRRKASHCLSTADRKDMSCSSEWPAGIAEVLGSRTPLVVLGGCPCLVIEFAHVIHSSDRCVLTRRRDARMHPIGPMTLDLRLVAHAMVRHRTRSRLG